MRVSTPSFMLLCLAAFATASPANTHVVHELAPEHPNDWAKLGTIEKNGLLPVRIGLTQQNLDQGHVLLMERSDPKSTKYGQHLTQDDVVELFAPHDDSVNAVKKWLQSEGISIDRISRSGNKQWIQFDATVDELESLLRTKYDIYESRKTGVRKVGADHYSIPKALQDHIDYITPGATKLQLKGEGRPVSTGRSRFRHQKRLLPPAAEAWLGSKEAQAAARMNVSSDCGKFITPRCLRELYGIPFGDSDIKGNEMGLYELQPYSPSSLTKFFKKYAPFIPEGTQAEITRIDGGKVFTGPFDSDDEAQLDIDVAYPIVYPQSVRMYDIDQAVGNKNGYFNTFMDALDGSYCNRTAFGITGDSPKYDPTYPHRGYNHTEMCGVFKPANVISISYGPMESDRTVNYDRRQCSEWMKLGLQGVTTFSATGDTGIEGWDGCLSGQNGQQVFNPYALVNCPYVVAVGSTVLPEGQDPQTGHEVATRSFGSSGGFSNYFPTPEWQKDAVDTYFETTPLTFHGYETIWGKEIGANGGVFNRAGRGMPDVSANGDNIVVVDYNTTSLSGGTSAASPIFGAVINRINEERLKANKPTVGFILPALYQNPGVLNDITSGNNHGCNTTGFLASKGWDPVTGLGTPNYPKMLDYFMSMGSGGYGGSSGRSVEISN